MEDSIYCHDGFSSPVYTTEPRHATFSKTSGVDVYLCDHLDVDWGSYLFPLSVGHSCGSFPHALLPASGSVYHDLGIEYPAYKLGKELEMQSLNLTQSFTYIPCYHLVTLLPVQIYQVLPSAL
jgi:hypothetical protein